MTGGLFYHALELRGLWTASINGIQVAELKRWEAGDAVERALARYIRRNR